MTSNPVRFRHVTKRTTRKADGTITHKPTRLKYTVAYSFQKDASGKLDIAYGIAQCRNGANGDTFNRAEGRDLAEARLSRALSGDAKYSRAISAPPPRPRPWPWRDGRGVRG